MGEAKLLLGTVRSQRAAAIDALFLGHAPHAILVTPTGAVASARAASLAERVPAQSLWGPAVLETSALAQALLEAEGMPIRRVDALERRLHLEAALDQTLADDDLAVWSAHRDNPGFVRHLLRIINELKQASIEPEAFLSRVEDAATAADRLIGRVYSAYQARLRAAGVYDVPGLYWEASLRCEQRKPVLLASVQALLFDGYDDFTPSELRFIETLLPHVSLLAIGLNHDIRPQRSDCHALTQRALLHLQKRFTLNTEIFESATPDSQSAFAADNIFWRDPPRLTADLRENLRVVPCADLLHELETIARDIRQLLLQGTNPSEIVVAFPSLREVSAPISRIFAEHGIDAALQQGWPLASLGAGRFILALGKACARWDRETVLSLLDMPWYRPADTPPAQDSFDQLARRAKIVEGRDEWRERLDTLMLRLQRSDRDPEMKDLLRRLPQAAEQAQALLDAVDRLQRHLATLPEAASIAEHALALDTLLETFEAGAASGAWSLEQGDREAAALTAIRTLLATLHDAAAPQTRTREEFFSILEDAMREVSIPFKTSSGGVRVVAMDALRNVQVRHVYIGGLLEGELPRPPSRNALYGDPDLERLEAAGVSLDSFSWHHQREMLLFHHALASAVESLTLSTRLQKAGGREAAQSAFLQDILDMFEGVAICNAPPRSDSFLPQPERAGTIRDLRNSVFERYGAAHGLADAVSATHGARVEDQRQGSAALDVHDGALAAPDIVQRLAPKLIPERPLSATQLETYLACPFHYWVKHVLRLDECEAPEAEFDDRVRGTIVHEALRALHFKFAGTALSEVNAEEAESVMLDAVTGAFEAHGWKSTTATRGLVRMERRRMERLLRRYLRLERDQPAEWKPTNFEVSFGGLRFGDDPLNSEEPLTLETPRGMVRFSGRIDRIDRSALSARIIDYKTGGIPAPKELNCGLKLQLLLYAMAFEEVLMPGTRCLEAHYVAVGGKERRNALESRGKNTLEQRKAAVQNAIATAIEGISNCYFAPVRAQKTCYGCGQARACRYDEGRLLRKGARPVLSNGEQESDSCESE